MSGQGPQGLTQGLRKNGHLHGLGREICGKNWLQMGVFDVGQLKYGYNQTPYYISFGGYNKDGFLTGPGFKLDANGTLHIGVFQHDILNGVGIVRTPENVLFGKFKDSDLEVGLVSTEESVHCGNFQTTDSGVIPHGEGVLYSGGLATRGTWCCGELQEIYDMVKLDIRSDEIKTHQGDTDSALSEVLKLMREFRSRDSLDAYNTLLGVRNFITTATDEYPKKYKPTIWNYPEKQYGCVHFYKDGAAYSHPTPSTKGVYVFPPGQRFSHFVGTVVKAKLKGRGLLYTTSGDRISATWGANGVNDSKATIRYKNRDRFQGVVDKDAYPISGVLTYTNGRVYSGSFVNNTVHGEGVFICQTGVVVKGTWVHGLLQGSGTHIYKPDHWTGVLTFHSGIPCGEGTVLVSASKKLLKLQFDNGIVLHSEVLADTGATAQLQEIQHDLEIKAKELQVERSRPTDIPIPFRLGVTAVTEEGIVVDIDCSEEDVKGYFVRLSCHDTGAPKLVKSNSKHLVVRDLEPGAQYELLAGIIRRRHMIPMGNTVTVTSPMYITLSHLLRKPELGEAEVQLALGGNYAKVYGMHQFPSLAADILSNQGRVGYDEATSSFVVV